MEKGFAVGEGDLNVCLFEGRWDRIFSFGGDFGDEYGWLSVGLGHGFQRADFWGERCCEEEGLAFAGGREGGEAGFDVWEHASWSGGEEAICFVENNHTHPPEACDCVCARGIDVVC